MTFPILIRDRHNKEEEHFILYLAFIAKKEIEGEAVRPLSLAILFYFQKDNPKKIAIYSIISAFLSLIILYLLFLTLLDFLFNKKMSFWKS